MGWKLQAICWMNFNKDRLEGWGIWGASAEIHLNSFPQTQPYSVVVFLNMFSNWWFQIFLFSPLLGKVSNLTSIFFQWGWFNHQLTRHDVFFEAKKGTGCNLKGSTALPVMQPPMTYSPSCTLPGGHVWKPQQRCRGELARWTGGSCIWMFGKWVFPLKRWVFSPPPNHPFFHRGFPWFSPSILEVFPLFLETPKWINGWSSSPII